MTVEQLQKDLAKYRALLKDLKQTQDIIADQAGEVIAKDNPSADALISACLTMSSTLYATAIIEHAIANADAQLQKELAK